jgi:dTDP-4-dehydrorhamnose 3,5-epimerase
MSSITPAIDGVTITPSNIIEVMGGDVLHAMKKSDVGYAGFGEAYFSTIEPSAIKAWKRHRKMTLNLLVPIGEIQFVLYDSRPHSPTKNILQEITLSRNNYQRLTVPPMVWMGFQSRGKKTALLLNIANISHNPDEVDHKLITEIRYDWN